MLSQLCDEFIKKCISDLENHKNSKIKKKFNEAKKELKANDEYLLNKFVFDLMRVIVAEDITEDIEDEMVLEAMNQILQIIKESKMCYKFKIELRGHEKELYRSVKIPSNFTLAEFGYLILSTFNTEGAHLFCFEFDKKRFISNIEGADPMLNTDVFYASNVLVKDLNFKKGKKLDFCYDFGDNYEFTIKFQGLDEFDFLVSEGNYFITDGKGYGIWEDNHYLMDMYYDSPKEFAKFIEDEEIDLEDTLFPFNEEFDLDENNEMILDVIEIFKSRYEDNCE